MALGSFLDMMVVSPKSSALDEMNAIVRWQRLDYRLKKILDRSGLGPTGYSPILLFKALVLQNLYGLSDPQTEEMLYDRLSFRRFCGLKLDGKIPDETTLCRFRGALKGKSESLFRLVMEDIEAQGISLKGGTIVDASVVSSSVTPPQGGSVSEADPEAGWTKKQGQFHYGYKAHVASSAETGLVKRVIATSADVHDSQALKAVVDRSATYVTADKAYDSKDLRNYLTDHGIDDRILHKKRAKKPQPDWQKALNKLWSKTRCRIEKIFGHWKEIHGLKRCRYKGWEKNQVHFDLLAMAYNLKRTVKILQLKTG